LTDQLSYLSGFGVALTSEALEGAVPRRQNSPRRGPYGLHAEQVNGTAFTVPRQRNQRTWLYRIRPSVSHGEFAPLDGASLAPSYRESHVDPNLLGFRPRPLPSPGTGVDFVAGLETIAGAASADGGLAVHTFACEADMVNAAIYNGDGDWMLIPDTGTLRITTELGVLRVSPGQLVVLPRGLLMSVALESGPARGLVFEIQGRHFELPERGPIGANGLADARHFQSPVASYEDREVPDGYRILTKTGGRLFQARRSYSPFDVVGWHGNYVPYRYDLSNFNGVGSVTWDHPDPSIFTVLSAPLVRPGENLADLVFFPTPRWDVAMDTFRPPYYHRNAAGELNAIITGPTSPERVFTRGGYFYTPPFTAHGVSAEVVERELGRSDDEANQPRYLASASYWIQLESVLPLAFSPAALASPTRDPAFREFASGARSYFDPERRSSGGEG